MGGTTPSNGTGGVGIGGSGGISVSAGGSVGATSPNSAGLSADNESLGGLFGIETASAGLSSIGLSSPAGINGRIGRTAGFVSLTCHHTRFATWRCKAVY